MYNFVQIFNNSWLTPKFIKITREYEKDYHR